MGTHNHDIADRRTTAVDRLIAGIDAAHPRRVVEETVTLEDRGRTLVVDDTRIDLAAIDDVLVAGGGNAAGYVAAALESILGDELVRTGATGTNVNDLRILVLDEPDGYDAE
ncbi:Hydroxypyruvate reductase [Natrialba taiwanensis DSM 12281]|uniref:Hydroxypyruvate reductase n=2 Tax=Natrialba taiwanensis TaxID=160846 RepID=M0A1I6_9EURY|nr:Hydroxypyruvate reductase [Natrialba taiwanensis DSM 12281]